ncbi:DJ-1/PfpI family protein [Amphibacillus sp. Q70]|uniref:DJ-1/PfpI family protein n=1 Tax=Amphibacillus sp. Q70 TaxID=3453416 RepID=UPI003F837A2B
MQTKKALVLIYHGMSLSEINLLTNYLTIYQPIDEEWQIDTVGAEKIPYETEDQFWVTPTKVFNEVNFSDYAVIIFPGIINPYPVAEDDRIIEFLQPLAKMENRPLISSMSSSPMLLAKSGILDGVKFTSGLFEETLNEFDFFQKENIIRQPLVYDEKYNIMTAINFAFREFAIQSAKILGFEISDDSFSGPRKNPPYTEEELTFYMDK